MRLIIIHYSAKNVIWNNPVAIVIETIHLLGGAQTELSRRVSKYIASN